MRRRAQGSDGCRHGGHPVTATAEEPGQPVEGFVDAFANGVFVGAEHRPYFAVPPFLEVPEHERLAVGFAQFHQALVQHSSQCFQQRGVIFHGPAKFDGGLFAALTAQFAPPPLAGLEQRGFVEPADQRCFAPQPGRPAGEGNEDILRNFLRCRRVAQPA